MTAGRTEPVNIHYGNNLATDFDYDFYIETAEQIVVEHTNMAGVKTVLTQGVDYSIAGIKDEDGGSIHFPLQGSTYGVLAWNEKTDEKEMLVISLDLPFEQSSEFDISGDLNKKNLEKALDYQMRCTQILNRKIGRAVLVQEGADAKPEELIESIENAKVVTQDFAQTAEQKATEAYNHAVTAGEEATIATQKVIELQDLYNVASEDITTKHTEATTEIETDRQSAVTEIANDKENALQTIKTKREEIEEMANALTANLAFGIAPSICTRLRIKKDENNVYLKWFDPNNTMLDNQYLCTWGGTMIVKKAGSHPTSIKDGIIVLDSKTRNQYCNEPFVDENLDTEGVEYFYTAFPYSTNFVYCINDNNNFNDAIVYEMIINQVNENIPMFMVTYPEGCINENFKPFRYNGLNPDYGDWGNSFFMDIVRPCMLYNANAGAELNRTVMEYLDKDNQKYNVDGEVSKIYDTTCNANAMVEWDFVAIKEEVLDNLTIKVSITNKPLEGFDYFPFQDQNGNILEHYYNAMFDGANVSNRIVSLAGLMPCVNTAGHTQIQWCQANGLGWLCGEYAFRRMENYILMMIGKSTDFQSVFGTGRHSGGSQSAYNQLASGMLVNYGMFAQGGDNQCVKTFYSENRWGNVWLIQVGALQFGNKLYFKMLEGLSDGSTVVNYAKTDAEVTANISKYINSNVTVSGTTGGYISKMTLVPHVGLVPTVVSGSSSTNFPDGCWWNGSVYGFARVGGSSAVGLLGGGFAFTVDVACSGSHWLFGVSLSCKSPS